MRIYLIVNDQYTEHKFTLMVITPHNRNITQYWLHIGYNEYTSMFDIIHPIMYLDSVDKLPVDVQRGHAVLQHAFAHDQHQVVPLALSDQLAAAETSAAGQDLIEGGFLT